MATGFTVSHHLQRQVVFVVGRSTVDGALTTMRAWMNWLTLPQRFSLSVSRALTMGMRRDSATSFSRK